MSRSTPHRWSAVLGAALVATVALVAVPGVAAEDGLPATLAYSHAASDVVVRYVELPGELAETGGGTTLTIRGDGSATVHYPAYMRRAGDHTTALPRAEVDALVASLFVKGVSQFDGSAVRQQLRSAETARAAALTTGEGGVVLAAVTDASTTIVELSLAAAVPAGATVLPQMVTHRAEWRGLRNDLAQHPSITALANLAAARAELRTVIDRVHTEATR